jgi:hypothetical protein
LEVAALVDGALNLIVDVGTRYYALHTHAAWASVQGELVGRAQRAIDALATKVEERGGKTLTDAGWCAADMWLFSAVAWLEAAPGRVATSQNIAQIMTLPWSLPAPLSRWAAIFRGREDVRTIYGKAS